MFFEEILNSLIAWLRSRKWRGLLRNGIALFLPPILMLGLVLYGWSLSKGHLAERYLTLVDQDVTRTMQDVNQAGPEPVVPNRELQVPLRRILQLGSSNERVTFIVANELARQSRLVMAERLMRDIAPAGGKGFPEAHAWLAQYDLARSGFSRIMEDKDAAERLLNDLAAAEKRATRVSPQLVLAYATLLYQFERGDEALRVLRTRASEFPELNMPYAELASKLGRDDEFKSAVEQGRADVQSRVGSGEMQVVDVARLVRFAELENDIDRSLATAQSGVRSAPDDPVLRRIYSDALCAKYQEVSEAGDQTNSGDDSSRAVVASMQYLDAAFKADPSNPRVVTEVAKAMALGQNLTAELRSALEASLVDGSAPAITHLIIANNKLASDDPSSAIPHLRLALRQLPNSAIVMNNLAIALLETQPDELGEAIELVEKAIQTRGNEPLTLAAMFDTQGQIRMAQNDPLGAIESYEKAIKLNAGKLDTRRRLAEVYRQVGMGDLADAQLRRVEELSEE